MTGSQKVVGSNPISSTKESSKAKANSSYPFTSSNHLLQLAIPLHRQIALGHTTLEMTRRYTQALGFDDVFKRHVVASPVDRLMH